MAATRLALVELVPEVPAVDTPVAAVSASAPADVLDPPPKPMLVAALTLPFAELVAALLCKVA